jgi:hypothetical protein
MPQMIAGLFLLYLVLAGIKQFARLSPAAAARIVRHSGGVLGLLGALLLVLRGSLWLASLVASVALGFAGWSKVQSFASGLGRGARSASPRTSQVRSATVEMTLDHDTGDLSGVVLAGPLQGRALETLTRADCLALHAAARGEDPDGARLLETYLDRRFAGWRAAAQDEGDARTAGGFGSGAMAQKEAYEILGLPQGAGPDEIARAHRTLMKKLHPDHGGSTSLAARVNQAKDVLLRRH